MNKTSASLPAGESLLLEEGASHFLNYIAVGGTIRLTNKRLVFKSCQSNQYQHEISITLDQIAGVEFFKTLFMNPNGLALLLKDGRMENFIVDDKKIWRNRIMDLISMKA